MITRAIVTTLLLAATAQAASATKQTEPARFTVRVAATKVYLLSGGKVEFIGKRPKSVPAAVSIQWHNFVQVLDMDMPPKDGVFNVNGQPIAPAIEITGRRGADAEIVIENRKIDLRFKGPGRCVLRAAVGRAWSRDVSVEVVQLPIWNGMTTSQLLERYGFPDKKQTVPGNCWDFWSYKQWPGAMVVIDNRYGCMNEVTQLERMEPDIRRRLRDMNPFAKVEKERTP